MAPLTAQLQYYKVSSGLRVKSYFAKCANMILQILTRAKRVYILVIYMITNLDLETCALIAANCAAGNLRQTTRMVSQMYDEALRPSGLRVTQFNLLVALTQTGPISISQLADVLDMDRTTLSRNLKPLEREGWVQTESDDDRRRRLIVLSTEGEAVLAYALPLWKAAQAQIVIGLGQDRFTGLLHELTAVQQVVRANTA